VYTIWVNYPVCDRISRYWCVDRQFQVWISPNMHFVVTVLRCWWPNHYVDNFFSFRWQHFLCKKSVIVISNRSSISQTCHQKLDVSNIRHQKPSLVVLSRYKSSVAFTSRQSGTVLRKPFGYLIKIWTIKITNAIEKVIIDSKLSEFDWKKEVIVSPPISELN